MLSAKELSIVYEALLAPGTMSTPVKITLNITRKQALLLAKVIDLGLTVEHESGTGRHTRRSGRVRTGQTAGAGCRSVKEGRADGDDGQTEFFIR